MFIEFEGAGCYALTTEQKIVSWTGYDSNIFSADSFKSDNMTNQITGDIMKAVFRLDENGLYVQYVAVPEPAVVASLLGIFAIALAIRRRK